jgi:hypothetical protein
VNDFVVRDFCLSLTLSLADAIWYSQTDGMMLNNAISVLIMQ